MSKLSRFSVCLLPCTVLRFWLGPHSISFLWFLPLYLPSANWTAYWIMFSVRVGMNRVAGYERITVPKLRRFFVWYLQFPGALVLSEIIYRGYVYNR